MSRKVIKIKFVGFWVGFNEKNNIYYNILSEKYDVEISDEPDYIIATMYAGCAEYMKYRDCVRIFHSGEDFFPDMNLFDYAAGYDCFKLHGVTSKGLIDRYFHWPYGCEWKLDEIQESILEKSTDEAKQILERKNKFCNFVYGHGSINGIREQLMEGIERYKHVDSAGSYKNNMSDGKIVSFANKIDFLRDYKFTIAAETLRYPGMTTEKIYDAFRADSIPIYFGNPYVKETFEQNAFIEWDGSKNNLDQVVNKIKLVDQNDELYIEMLRRQKVLEKEFIKKLYLEFSEWLWTIFSLEKDDAMQHVKVDEPSQRDLYEKELKKKYGI